MNTTPSGGLAALTELPEYRVRAEDTDPRGWSVTDANGATIGAVSDLIIDVDGLVARYIVCVLARGDQRAVLLPTGFARFDKDRAVVHLDFLTISVIEQLPRFEGLPLSANSEAQMEQALTGVSPTTSPQAKIVRRSD